MIEEIICRITELERVTFCLWVVGFGLSKGFLFILLLFLLVYW